MTIQVKENPRDRGLVELHLRYDLEAFTEGNRKQLVRKIAVLLEVERESVNFEGMKLFGVNQPSMYNSEMIWLVEVRKLQPVVGFEPTAFEKNLR